MTDTKPKRRWFRFSLWTLFVLVTIIGVGAGWVLYQLNWIRQRHELIAACGHQPMIAMFYNGETSVVSNGAILFTAPDPPWSLRLFGEKPFLWIAINDYERADSEIVS